MNADFRFILSRAQRFNLARAQPFGIDLKSAFICVHLWVNPLRDKPLRGRPGFVS